MKLKFRVIWMSAVICALALAVFADFGRDNVALESEVQQQTALAAWESQSHPSHEATVTDSTLLYRVSNSRPQRILPTNGSRNARTMLSSGNCGRQFIVKSLLCFYGSRCLCIIKPFCLSASCDDYFIALRHIIR